MRNNAKRAAALDLLAATGMRTNTYAPPFVRMLWWIGIDIPPPHFAGFLTNAILTGLPFSVVWGMLMWVVMWKAQGMPYLFATIGAILTGIIYGCAMAGYYAWGKHKYQLPTWKDVPGRE